MNLDMLNLLTSRMKVLCVTPVLNLFWKKRSRSGDIEKRYAERVSKGTLKSDDGDYCETYNHRGIIKKKNSEYI